MQSSAIIFASINRPQMLHESVLCAVEQTVPSQIVISVPGEKHVLPETLALPGVELVIAGPGASAQRNAGLRRVSSREGVVFFFDDDVEIERHYVENMLDLFARHPELSLAAGVNVGLGAKPGTLTRSLAKTLIEKKVAESAKPSITSIRSVNGCRMAFRADLLDVVQFDERLPLYSYMEDFDFSLQCRKYGSIVLNEACLMVHIEAGEGRVGTRKRGYSEIVNPVYIMRKKTGASFSRTMLGSIRRTLGNARRLGDSAGREQFIGNVIGWSRVIAGKADPEYVLQL